MNYGLDLKKQQAEQELPEKHLMGGIELWPEINPTGDWTDVWNAINPETQFGARLETMGCTGYGTANILEMIWLKQYGLKINLSDRFINKMSGTTRSGNSVDAPIDTIRKYGFLYEEEWPWDRETFEWDEYYAEIPQKLIDLAKTRLNDWDFAHQYITNKSDIPSALRTSPLGTTVYAWDRDEKGLYTDNGKNPNHWTVGLLKLDVRYNEAGDSYPEDFNCGDSPQQPEFVKNLRKDFNFGCVKRYKIIDKRSQKKKTLTLLNKSMKDLHYYWDYNPETKKGGHNFYRVGVPSGETKKYRQAISWSSMTSNEKMLYLGLRETMTQSSWAIVSQYPDIATIGKSFV